MNKVVLSLLGCSGSITSVLGMATVASPDAAKTIPYPEVMNLKKVPTFNERGIVRKSYIATNSASLPATSKQVKAQPKPKVKVTPINFTLLGRDLQSPLASKYRSDLVSRKLAPANAIVLGYSNVNGTVSTYPQTTFY